MKQTICIGALALGLWSCNNKATEQDLDKIPIDTVQEVPENKHRQDIIIRDKSQYGQSFIDGLSGYDEPLQLVENYLLVGQDTVYFPEEVPRNSKTLFKGTKDQKSFVLAVTRTNLTNLDYTFQLLDKDGRPIESRSGTAVLGSLFFLGSETDDDDETGEGYLSAEYSDPSPDCSFAIRIGEKDGNGKLRAKIKLHYEHNESRNIDLDDHPTLRTE